MSEQYKCYLQVSETTIPANYPGIEVNPAGIRRMKLPAGHTLCRYIQLTFSSDHILYQSLG